MKQMLIISLLVFNHVAAKQQFYKWTDADGNTHYTDQKPEGKKTAEVTINTPSAAIGSSLGSHTEKKPKKEKTTQQKLDDYAQQNKTQRAKDRAKRNRCRSARKSLKQFQASMTFRTKDIATGGYRYLDANKEAKRKKYYSSRIQGYKKKIRKACK